MNFFKLADTLRLLGFSSNAAIAAADSVDQADLSFSSEKEIEAIATELSQKQQAFEEAAAAALENAQKEITEHLQLD